MLEVCSLAVAVAVAHVLVAVRESIYAKTPRTVLPRRVNGRTTSRPPRQYPLSARFQSQPQPIPAFCSGNRSEPTIGAILSYPIYLVFAIPFFSLPCSMSTCFEI